MKSRVLIFIAGGVLGVIIILLLIGIFAGPIGIYLLTWHTRNLEHKRLLAVEDAKKSISYVQQFIELYPDAIHNFSYYTGEYGPPTWSSEVGLYGRYILTMQIPVQFNEDRTSIANYGEPSFHLDEVESITEEGDRLFVTHSNFQIQFGKEEWELLVKNNGDISILAEKISKNNPISGFEEYWTK